MTEVHRQRLLQACAFATVFIEGANRELKGADPDQRIEAAEQLRAALDQLDPPVYNPDINRSSTEPYL